MGPSEGHGASPGSSDLSTHSLTYLLISGTLSRATSCGRGARAPSCAARWSRCSPATPAPTPTPHPNPHPKLLQAGTWTTLRKGATLQEEGQPSASVFLLVSGGADVAVGGKKVLSRKGKHQFIGDAGLSLGIAIAEPQP